MHFYVFAALVMCFLLLFICIFYVNYQIEQEERANIDAIKEEECKKATEAIERWKENQRWQSSREQESLEEVTMMEDNRDSKLEFRDKEPDIVEAKIDPSVDKTQKTNQKPTVKKQPCHNKQRTAGIFNLYFVCSLKL